MVLVLILEYTAVKYSGGNIGKFGYQLSLMLMEISDLSSFGCLEPKFCVRHSSDEVDNPRRHDAFEYTTLCICVAYPGVQGWN